jgi:hypothetical protein
VARETKAYLASIEKVTSIDAFLKNDRVYRYAMTAFGLEDMIYAKAFMKKVLTEGIDNRASFANTLTDSRFKEFAKVFDFARHGETTTSSSETRQGTVDLYVRQALERQAGAQNEGVRLALYFARKAPELTDTLGILADKALLTVVRTALAMPPAGAAQDVDKEAEMLAKRLDVADFKNAKKLERFINRFTSLWEIGNGRSTTTPLEPGRPVEAGIGGDLLASLQNLKLGGR